MARGCCCKLKSPVRIPLVILFTPPLSLDFSPLFSFCLYVKLSLFFSFLNITCFFLTFSLIPIFSFSPLSFSFFLSQSPFSLSFLCSFLVLFVIFSSCFLFLTLFHDFTFLSLSLLSLSFFFLPISPHLNFFSLKHFSMFQQNGKNFELNFHADVELKT